MRVSHGDPVGHFRRLLDKAKDEERQVIVNLARAQLEVEQLRDSDRDWRRAIVKPPGAAGCIILRAILEAGEQLRILPDESDKGQEEAALMIAGGHYFTWPPTHRVMSRSRNAYHVKGKGG